jgi:hypothetical protein
VSKIVTAKWPIFAYYVDLNHTLFGFEKSLSQFRGYGSKFTDESGHEFHIQLHDGEMGMAIMVQASEPNPDLSWLDEIVSAYEVVQKQWGATDPVEILISYSPDAKKD